MGLDKLIDCAIPIDKNIMEDIMESFMGAVYYDQGLDIAIKLFIKLIEKHKDFSQLLYEEDNYKDMLLRYFHQMGWGHPIYTHNGVCFVSPSEHVTKYYGRGKGNDKLSSEQLASKDALIKLGIIVDGQIDPDWFHTLKESKPKIEKKDVENKEAKIRYNQYNRLLNKYSFRRIIGRFIKSDNIHLNDALLYHEALTHSSYTEKDNHIPHRMDKYEAIRSVPFQKKSYERMIFLGNAVIHMILASFLFQLFPKEPEGFLTRLRIKLENGDTLAYLAKRIKLTKYILLSLALDKEMDGRNNTNILSSAFEGFFGAIYLDHGFSFAYQLLSNIINTELDIEEMGYTETGFKDLLIFYYRDNNLGAPNYVLEKTDGPDHKKEFTIALYHPRDKGRVLGRAKASSKKRAEKLVAKQAYTKLTENL